mgnify:CR=1 FL=1
MIHFRFLNPFVQAASSVLRDEFGIQVQPGNARLQSLADTFAPVSMLLFCAGQQVRGTVLFAMDKKMATALLSHILDSRSDAVGVTVYQAVAEFGGLITGRAGAGLAGAGFQVVISPPAMLIGEDTLNPRLDVPGLVIPLHTEWGQIEVYLTVRQLGSEQQVGKNGAGEPWLKSEDGCQAQRDGHQRIRYHRNGRSQPSQDRLSDWQ